MSDSGVGVQIPMGALRFFFKRKNRMDLGPIQQYLQWVHETSAPVVRQPKQEADKSPRYRADVCTALYPRPCVPSRRGDSLL